MNVLILDESLELVPATRRLARACGWEPHFIGSVQELELAGDELNAPGKALEDLGLIGHRHGRSHQGQALIQQFLAARALEVIELSEPGGFGFLHGLKGGPLEQEPCGQGPPQILATEFKSLREVLF